MVRNQEPQAPPQQTPLVAATQPIVDQEALNGQLEDVGANDDNKDRDSDNNNKDDNNNAVNCPDHGTEGEKTTKNRKQGLFWSLRPELQDAIIQSVIEDAPEQQKSIKEELVAQGKAKKEKEQLIRELNLRNATKAYIDAMGGPGDVPGERALGSATDQNCWNLTVLTSSDNPPLLHDINSAPLDYQDSDNNNNEDKDNNAVNWLDHWSLCPEVQEAMNNELELFLVWLQQKHPDDFSRHVEYTGGGYQDLYPMTSHPIIWNRELCVEYLDERLCVPGNVDTLQMNLSTALCLHQSNFTGAPGDVSDVD